MGMYEYCIAKVVFMQAMPQKAPDFPQKPMEIRLFIYFRPFFL